MVAINKWLAPSLWCYLFMDYFKWPA